MTRRKTSISMFVMSWNSVFYCKYNQFLIEYRWNWKRGGVIDILDYEFNVLKNVLFISCIQCCKYFTCNLTCVKLVKGYRFYWHYSVVLKNVALIIIECTEQLIMETRCFHKRLVRLFDGFIFHKTLCQIMVYCNYCCALTFHIFIVTSH